jgi:iron complex outermembrane receptor protein
MMSAFSTVVNGPQPSSPAAKALQYAAAILALIAPIPAARAQHASDDPLAVAADAFGLTLGFESIGLYGPGNIRGFNPQTAGNVRVDGLYFDQQGGLSNRVVEGSTIRVGVSEIGYAFPAPTGIVDYDLRHAGDKPTATVVVNSGPYQAGGASVDANLPLIPNELQVPMGASYGISTGTIISNNPGYTSNYSNFGATPQWKPTDWLTIRGIFDWQQVTNWKTLPLIFTAGDFLPPKISRGYYGQNWAEGNYYTENYGGTVKAQINQQWTFAAGLFRSIVDNPVSYSDLYLNTLMDGSADHNVVGYPEQRVASTSGEARLTGRFSTDGLRHEIMFMARGRDTLALYGGADVVDVGPAFINSGAQAPKPDFTFTARTNDRTKLWSAGTAYRAQWLGHGDFSVGVQQESYRKDVNTPGIPASQLTDRPLRVYGSGDWILSDRLTAYAGYTQGLEDSGTAPGGALNRGAVLPDARTWQMDTGVRYLLTPDLKLITGVFKIEKPYFNLDTSGVDRMLGVQRAEGFETSVSGEIIKNLNVNAAILLGPVKIVGPNLSAEGVGPIAYGQPHSQWIVNADYKFTNWPGFSVDTTLYRFGTAPGSVDNVVQNPAVTALALGARYRFTIMNAPTTLRVQVNNLLNAYYWNMTFSPGYSQFSPRSVFAYLTTDF